ncbi:MAG TPA: hypothetical protein VJI32_03455, partial [Candidatus Nanoarchaeia archaeon]|nr:hypothetical protein [Candidatus Nanoarchaeia archaeon]
MADMDEDTIVSTPEIIISKVHRAGSEIALIAIRKLEVLQKTLRPLVLKSPGTVGEVGHLGMVILQSPFTSFRLSHVEKYDKVNVREKKNTYIIDYWINILGSKMFGFRKKPLVGIQIKLTIGPDIPVVTRVEIVTHYNKDFFDINALSRDKRGKEKTMFYFISRALGDFEAIPERIPRKLNAALKGYIDAQFVIDPLTHGEYFTVMPYEGILA